MQKTNWDCWVRQIRSFHRTGERNKIVLTLSIIDLQSTQAMKNKLDCIAFHEAGHAVGHILTGIPFKYVTIKEDEEKDELGGKTLGHVNPDEPMSKEEWEKKSILNPKEFNIFFKEDFIILSGSVAEMIYRRRSNYKSSKEDFRQWVGTSLIKLPEKLSSKYQSFILEYIVQVLIIEINWSNITAVALASIDEETLNYERVCEVIEQNKNNPVLY